MIVEGSSRAFAVLGYDRANMSLLAESSGVALATLYRYAENKEELFELALRHGFGGPLESLWSASGGTGFEESVLSFTRSKLKPEHNLPLLFGALEGPAGANAISELKAVVGELYDALERFRIPIRMLDRSARDWPELAFVLVTELRDPAILRLTRFLELRCGVGDLLQPPDLPAAARSAAEICALHAIDRPFSPGGAWTDDATARDTALRYIIAAFEP